MALPDTYDSDMGALVDEMGFPNPFAAIGRALGGGRRRRPGRAVGPRQWSAGGPRYAPGRVPGFANMFAPPQATPAQAYNIVNPPASQLQGGIYTAAWQPFTFTLATGLAPITLDMSPIAAFRGRRLACTVIRNGASVAASVPLISILQVGATPMLLGGEVPAEVFAANSFDTNLTFPLTTVGTPYRMTIRPTVAAAGADTLIVLATVIGDA